jgi:hypothetical protein
MKWVTQNLGTVLSIAINLVVIGAIYATMRGDISHNTSDVAEMKVTKADKTIVAEHEKRLDAQDRTLQRMDSKLDTALELLGRIDERTSRAKL